MTDFRCVQRWKLSVGVRGQGQADYCTLNAGYPVLSPSWNLMCFWPLNLPLRARPALWLPAFVSPFHPGTLSC